MLRQTDPGLQQSFALAMECQKRGDLAGAEAIYSRLLALDPGDSEVLYLFGCLQMSKGEQDVGLECLRLAQQLDPKDARMPYSIATVLQETGKTDEAIVAYRQALAINPLLREAWENLCAACYDTDDFAQGLAAARQAMSIAPDSLLAIRGAANCLAALGRRADALEVLELGVGYHPALPELRIHRAWELMANGQFAAGWRALEWRHSRKGKNDASPRSVPFPRWNGETLDGQTVLVYGEQGIGDEVMFAPFVLALMRAGAKCVLECERRLVQPFAKAFPGCQILPRSAKDQIAWCATLPMFDYCISALSLPLYFEHPLDGAAFLLANPDRRDYWRRRLDAYGGSGLKVGVSWRGGADPKAQMIRSVPPAQFGAIVDGQHTFVSLQYGTRKEEVAAVSADLVHFPEIDPLVDLEEFFALVSALDAVVSVDNSTVHFAGALGVPTLLMLPVYAEWRWGNAAYGVSPWYRSVEIVRQREASANGWREVMVAAGDWLQAGVFNQSAIATPVLFGGADNVLQVPAPSGRKALLVGDTNYWYHWGCSCTSLGLHEGLRTRFDAISVVPLVRLHTSCPSRFDTASLDSDAFFEQFGQSCPDVIDALRACDYVIINGEGSIHGASPIALTLLYIAYVAKHRLGKQTAIINHSCFPGESEVVAEFYARVYRSLDVAVVRERTSFAIVSAWGGKTVQGFDALPLFLEKHGSTWTEGGAWCPIVNASRKIVLGGSVTWTQELVNCFTTLAQHVAAAGYAVEVVSGAKAFLAADEVGFVEQLTMTLKAWGVAYQLRFPISEREWLEAIGSASLVVSGRFHYSIAAAFQGIPFMVAGSNTAKIDGLLEALGLESGAIRLTPESYEAVVRMADRLLESRRVGRVETEILAALRGLARENFQSL